MSANKKDCPKCALLAACVMPQTIKHHLKQPWLWQDRKETYFFCASPQCKVAYFSQGGEVMHTQDLRQKVGIKSKDDDALLCYCFDVSRAEVKKSSKAKAYVMAQTKAKQCACYIRNPSGQCCLKDFKVVERVK